MAPGGGLIRRSGSRIALAALLAAALPGVALAGLLPGGGSPSGATGFFSVSCRYSHSLADDPIVQPGRPGASHRHDFLGNTSTSADSTLESLRAAPTGCRRGADHSAYWVPSLFQFDAPVEPRNAAVYYRTARREPASIATLPAGLRVIAGDSKATGVQPRSVMHWSCTEAGARELVADPAPAAQRRRGAVRRRRAAIRRHRRAIGRLRAELRAGGGDRSRLRRAITRRQRAIARARRANRRDGRGLRGSPGVPTCAAGSMLKLTIELPDCWNGLTLDSADHRSHMAYSLRMRGGARACPASHGVPVPSIALNVRYPTRGGPAVRLASGEAYTAHADFFNAWDDAALDDLVRRCLRADVNCRGS